MAFIPKGDQVLEWLKACGVDPPKEFRRVIVDLEVGALARIYFDCFAPIELLGKPLDLSGSEVRNG